MENAWTTSLKNTLAQHEENGLSEKELRFYHVDKLFEMAKHSYQLAETCETCSKHKNTIVDIASNLDTYLDGSNVNRKNYERHYNSIESHLKQSHKLATPLQNQYQRIFIGMIVGAAVGYPVGLIFNPNFLQFFVLIGWFIGVVIGQVTGMRKEKELKKQGKYIF